MPRPWALLICVALSAPMFACAPAEENDLNGGFDETEAVRQAQQKPPGMTGGSCSIAKCNGILDPFGVLQCAAPGLCQCVHGGTVGGCSPGTTSCTQSCQPTPTRSR
jgi:hypothetical protein